jgi:hypothetical protein
MKRFKAYATHQSYLLPPSPREWLPADHLVYFIPSCGKRLRRTRCREGRRRRGLAIPTLNRMPRTVDRESSMPSRS